MGKDATEKSRNDAKPDVSDIFERVRSFINQHALLEPGEQVLVGVSGGVDSVTLLYVLLRLGYRPEIAHINYQLRGEASRDDEAFVRTLGEQWSVPVHVATFDTRAEAAARRLSVQETARDLRYTFFAEVAASQSLRTVAVGHHMDDQVETVLLNMLRGTGLEGVAGMAPSRRLQRGADTRLVRPLLSVRRTEIERLARSEGLPWREDASNADPKYRRNVLREQVLPVLEQEFGRGAIDSMARSASMLRQYAEGLWRELARHFFRAAERGNGDGRLDLVYLQTVMSVWRGRLILEALARWLPEVPRSAAVVDAIEQLLEAQPGRRVEFVGGTVWREREHLSFVPGPRAPHHTTEQYHVQPGQDVTFERGIIRVDLLEHPPDKLDTGGPTVVFADAESIEFPLVLRRWQPGDRFRPLGMRGSKKVSDFLTDEKVPVHLRSSEWVLVSEGQVVWVVGRRLSEDVRVHPNTRAVARLAIVEPT